MTLRAIGSASGKSRGAPYRHFPSKKHLLDAVAAQGMADVSAAMTGASSAALSEGEPAARRLEAVLMAYFDAALRRPQTYRLMYRSDEADGHGELEAAGAVAFGLLLASVEDALGEAGRQPVGTSRQVAAVVWSAVHGLVDLTLSAHGRRDKGLDDPRALVRLLAGSTLRAS